MLLGWAFSPNALRKFSQLTSPNHCNSLEFAVKSAGIGIAQNRAYGIKKHHC
jgi:hypothetical protein